MTHDSKYASQEYTVVDHCHELKNISLLPLFKKMPFKINVTVAEYFAV